MTNIKNVTLAFRCSEKLTGELSCNKCCHKVVDFRNKTAAELQADIDRATRPVCGIFKKSQLSEHFLKYAATTTFLATSLAVPAREKEISINDSLLIANEIQFKIEESTFLGFVVESQAIPIGGYGGLFEAIANQLKYPVELKEKGESLIEVTIDRVGRMWDVKLIKGFNEAADNEAVRVLTTLNYPFTPAKQGEKPIESKLLIPILFDPAERRRLKVVD
jgi:hypothetical protein